MVKQLLTLATGSIGGIIAFFDNDKVPGVQLEGSPWIVAAIAFLAASVIAGIFTLGSLIRQLAKTKTKANVNDREVRVPAMVQNVAFAAGIIAVAAEIMRAPIAIGELAAAIVLACLLAFLVERAPKWWCDRKKRKAAKTVPDDPSAMI
jgi:hypothetical protein